ncbi:MAG: sugar ABC transporter permease [Actinomycetota bacterium]|nr:sugar ABC transporter permease [Actinomycetota bacterium]
MTGLATTALPDKKARRNRASRREAIAAYGFISPWLIGFVFLTAGPMLASLVLSFTDYNLLAPADTSFVGTDNYGEALFDDALVMQSLRVTAYFATLAVALDLVLGLALALLLNTGFRAIGAIRTIYYLPAAVSGVAVSLLWLWIFQPSGGLANGLLELIGLSGTNWVYSTTWVIPAFVLMSLWGVGRSAFIYLAILQRIPTNLYEAAAVDGAGPLRRFFRITVPLVTPAIFLNLVLGLIGNFQTFTQAFVISEGGPANASLFFTLYLYRNAFRYFRIGYASALAWIMFALLLVLTLLVFRSARRWVYYEAGGPGEKT